MARGSDFLVASRQVEDGPGGTRVTQERLEQEPEFWAGLWGRKRSLKGQANALESW